MSGGGWNGRGPGDGFGRDPGYYGDPNPSESSSSSSRGVPIYLLFLIMLASGVFTLIFLWICVQYIFHRRRVRRTMQADPERVVHVPRPWGPDGGEQIPLDATAPGAKDVDSDPKRCDTIVELTYVVMAGEEQPTFLARPLNTAQQPPSPSSLKAPEDGDGQANANPEKTSAS